MKAAALDIFNQTLSRMKPEKLVQRAVSVEDGGISINGKRLQIGDKERVWVIGAGKASARMAAGLELVLGERIKDGMVISPKGNSSSTRRIQIFPGSHPWPDEDSVSSTLELLEFAENIPENGLVFVLISGGTSALMEVPAKGLILDEIRKTYDLLLKSGATIHEMNTVRKHLSAVKGGKLLKSLRGKRVINLLMSDVPGDDPRSIGSGPTVTGHEKAEKAVEIINRYGLSEKLPVSVRSFLKSEALKVTEDNLVQPDTHLIGTARVFAEEAASLAKKAGFSPEVADSFYDGPIEEVADTIFKKIKKSGGGKRAFLFYGESTVEVTGSGKGGRNQHLALLLAQKISGRKDVVILSAGTDGGDGPTDAAGAAVDGNTVDRAQKLGMDAKTYVETFDAYHFFKSLGDLIFTGPTGNNLMDFQLILTDR